MITSVDKDAEKKVTEEEIAINDQSRIIYKGDESGMLVEHEVNWTLLLQHSNRAFILSALISMSFSFSFCSKTINTTSFT